MSEKPKKIHTTWNIYYEVRTIVLKIRDYKRSKNLNTDAFQTALNEILDHKHSSDGENLEKKLINILKIEEKDDSIQIAILNSFIKIFKSIVFLQEINFLVLFNKILNVLKVRKFHGLMRIF